MSPENWLTLLLTKLRFSSKRDYIPVLIFLAGLVLIGVGVLSSRLSDTSKVEVLQESIPTNEEVIVEVSGAVETPGVYKLQSNQRVEDALVLAGGLSANADRNWVEKTLNRAAKLADGQKIYIPYLSDKQHQSGVLGAKESGGDQSVSPYFSGRGSGLVNINTASLNQLDELPGIGPVYGQSIIDHRPYSTIEELLSKGAIKQSVYDKIKDKITVY